MIHAAIDLGTNAIRLMVAEEIIDHKIRILQKNRLIVRLGEGLARGKIILPESLSRTVTAVKKFSTKATSLNAKKIRLLGTSVWREAENQEASRQALYNETGLLLQVISGEIEAKLASYGVIKALGLPQQNLVIVDIGGGSTEIIYFPANSSPSFGSIHLGAVWLTEKFLLHDPPYGCEWEQMSQFCQSTIEKNIPSIPLDAHINFVGTGGTATTLAAIEQKQDLYDPAKINNSVISLSSLEALADYLRTLSIWARGKVCGLEKGREDIILAGLAILITLMKTLKFNRLIVSDAGLLEGIIWHEISPSPFLDKFS